MSIFEGEKIESEKKAFEVMPTPEIDSRIEWDVQLSSFLFTLEDSKWGSAEHPLAEEARRHFSEHPIPDELLQDWRTLFDEFGADEESVQNLALARQHPEMEGDVLKMIAEHKPNIKVARPLQTKLDSVLERFDALFTPSELAEKFRTALSADQQARLQRKDETRKMLGVLIDFFKPDQKTTSVKKVNFVPTDPLRRKESGWGFQSGEELTVVSHIENTGNQEHEFLHCIINPIVAKLGGRLTAEQQKKISTLATTELRDDYGDEWYGLLCEEVIRSYNDVFQRGGGIETYEEFQKKIAGLSENQFQAGLIEKLMFRKKCDALGIRTVEDFREKSREFYDSLEKNQLRGLILKLYQDYVNRSNQQENFETFFLRNFISRI